MPMYPEIPDRIVASLELDRTEFIVSPEVYAAILARLDAPPQPNERLRKTMWKTAAWE